MKILFWNCQGLGNLKTLNYLKQLIDSHKPLIIGIAEPKIPLNDGIFILNKFGFNLIGSSPPSPNICRLWDFVHYSIKDVNLILQSDQLIHFSYHCFNVIHHCSIIYAFNNYIDRRFLWSSLESLDLSCNCPWIICGDFNAILQKDEKIGPSFSKVIMKDFRKDRKSVV